MTCGACPEPPVLSWQRWATEQELAELHATGDLPLAEESAKLMVFACDAHAITPELAAATHGATCSAPPVCDCDPTV